MQVIIPSATLVPEKLQNLGKLPAVIYPINQKLVFDYLHEQYKNASFRVISYENAEKVIEKLKGYSNTEVLILPQLKDLGYSLKIGLGGVSGEIIINFGDTLIFNEQETLSADSFYFAEEEITDTWTFFEEKNGVITNIIDKQTGVAGTGKLFCGVFCISDAEYFSHCLYVADGEGELNTFYSALMLYSQKYSLRPVRAEDWLDIGHLDNYYASQIEVKAREFNHIRIDKHRGILTKYSDDKDKLIGEILWYLRLPADVEYIRPRIFDYSAKYEYPYVSMEYYSYHTIHELFLYGDISKSQWIDIFQRIKFIISDLQRYTVTDNKICESLEDVYLVKTINRIETLRDKQHFTAFFNNPIVVNGITYRNLNGILDVLKKEIPSRLYNIKQLNIIHGDLCFSNVMIDNNFNFIKVIDPRGKFGKFDIYGDPRYELAKLLHSIDGKYDFIIKDLFQATYHDSIINYVIKDRVRDFDLFQVFLQVFRQNINSKKSEIELIEAILFLSMIPLHEESIDQQIVMLATGLDILNRVVDITEDNV